MREAIILAGGLGTRLRSELPDTPKCMAPVSGKPFLSYLISLLQSMGIEKFIFSVGYRKEMIEEFISNKYSHLQSTFSAESEPLGTGGAIKLACRHVVDKTVLIVNGDTYFDVQLPTMEAFHHMCGSHCTLALKPMVNFDRYGAVELKKDYSVANFQEKRFYNEGLINGGVYILNAGKFLQEELPDQFSFEKDYLEKYLGERRIYGVVQDRYFIDIGIPEDYQRAQKELPVQMQKTNES